MTRPQHAGALQGAVDNAYFNSIEYKADLLDALQKADPAKAAERVAQAIAENRVEQAREDEVRRAKELREIRRAEWRGAAIALAIGFLLVLLEKWVAVWSVWGS